MTIKLQQFTVSPAGKIPEAHEEQKAEAQRAMDIAYTINHALACTVTDAIDPYIGNMSQKYLGKKFSIGCGHDHSKGAPEHICGHVHHNHEHHEHHRNEHPQQSHLKHWWIGELVGDFGAVPVTIAVQHYFPGFMKGLRGVMEPMLGGFFRRGAERSSLKWAQRYGIATDSQEYKKHVEAVYEHEVSHLPQAFMWTASSVVINLCTQRIIGNKAPLWQLATGKIAGVSISAGMVVGARGFAPGAAEKWDNFTSEHIFLPATKKFGNIIGIKKEDVDRMAEQQRRLKSGNWTDRMQPSNAYVAR